MGLDPSDQNDFGFKMLPIFDLLLWTVEYDFIKVFDFIDFFSQKVKTL